MSAKLLLLRHKKCECVTQQACTQNTNFTSDQEYEKLTGRDAELSRLCLHVSFPQSRELEEPDVTVGNSQQYLTPTLQGPWIKFVQLVKVAVDDAVFRESVCGAVGGWHDVGSEVEGRFLSVSGGHVIYFVVRWCRQFFYTAPRIQGL